MAGGASPERHSTSRRLITYSLIVVGLGLSSYAVGERLPGHSHTTTAEATDPHGDGAHSDGHGSGMSHDGDDKHAVSLVGAATTGGEYELVEKSRDGRTAAFAIRAGDDEVAEFERAHGAYLHVVMVTPDLTRFEHVHPDIDADGTWLITAPDDSEWHVVFEATPAGAPEPVIVTSHFDGTAASGTLPLPTRTARIATASGADLVVELSITDSGMQFAVSAPDGSPVTGLEAYLEQPAHLVAFRADDLAYVHLHPTSDIGDPVITYDGVLPAGSTYRLFLQCAVDGDIVTVPFTLVT